MQAQRRESFKSIRTTTQQMQDKGKEMSNPDSHFHLYSLSPFLPLFCISWTITGSGMAIFISKNGEDETQNLNQIDFVSVPINLSSMFSWN